MRLRAAICVLLMGFAIPEWAATKTVTANGLWSTSGTWSAAGQPAAGDDIVVPADKSVILDAAATCADGSVACGRTISIAAGGSIMLGHGATFLWINCSTATSPCIDVSGTLIVGAHQTLKIGADGGGVSNPDRVRVNSGGILSVQGRKLASGAVSAVITDERTITEPYLATGLPTRNFEIEDSGARFPLTGAAASVWVNGDDCTANCYALRFTSGDRKGRWYNTLTPASAANLPLRMSLDFDARHEPACVGGNKATCGAGIVESSNKSDGFGQAYVTGTASVSGSTVTGSGTSWAMELANGSRWYCDTDGPTSAGRVVRVVSGTSLILDAAYAGAGCAALGAYHLVNDRQPYPFVDHSEHVKPGDAYDIIDPATLQGAVITTGAEPTGASAASYTNIECSAGSTCLLGPYAVLKWLGGATSSCTTDGDAGIWFDNPSSGTAILDSELMGAAACLWIKIANQNNFEFARNYQHFMSPTLCGNDQCHGMNLKTNDASPSLEAGFNYHDNRVEQTVDDAVVVDAPQSGLRIRKNIFKYIGASNAAQTANCTQFLPSGNNPSGSYYFSDNQVTENVCMNVGSIKTANGIATGDGSAAGFTWDSIGSNLGTGYRADIGFSGNLVANIQNGAGIGWQGDLGGTPASASEFIANNITYSGNLVSNTAYDGLAYASRMINNVALNWGLDRQTTRFIAGIQDAWVQAAGNVTIPIDESIATSRWVGTSAARLGMFYPDQGNPAPNAYGATVTVQDNAIFGHRMMLMNGSTTCVSTMSGATWTVMNNYVGCELQRESGGNNVGIDIWQGTGTVAASITNNVINACADIGISKRACTGAVNPSESSNYITNTSTPVSGFTISGSDKTGNAPGWSPLSLAFDRRRYTPETQGPRSVGLPINSLWKSYFASWASGTSLTYTNDTDGDGASDLFDNCVFIFNPTQLDSDGDGKGNACDASP